jgi:hypothetical protein
LESTHSQLFFYKYFKRAETLGKKKTKKTKAEENEEDFDILGEEDEELPSLPSEDAEEEGQQNESKEEEEDQEVILKPFVLKQQTDSKKFDYEVMNESDEGSDSEVDLEDLGINENDFDEGKKILCSANTF